MPNAKATQLHMAPRHCDFQLGRHEQGQEQEKGQGQGQRQVSCGAGPEVGAGDGSFMFELMHFMCTSIFPYLYLQSFAVNIFTFFSQYTL